MEKVQDGEIDTVAGEQKSEFAVFLEDEQVFSRIEQRRFPELADLLEIYSQSVTS